MSIKYSAAAFAVTTLLAGGAMAQMSGESAPAGGSTNAPKFEEVDQNADGNITADEAQDTWLASVFVQVDANQDGVISKSEYEMAIG